MIEKPIQSDTNQEYASLKRENNALSRKFARLGKEYENLTQLYKQAGNGVTVNVVYYIGCRIADMS